MSSTTSLLPPLPSPVAETQLDKDDSYIQSDLLPMLKVNWHNYSLRMKPNPVERKEDLLAALILAYSSAQVKVKESQLREQLDLAIQQLSNRKSSRKKNYHATDTSPVFLVINGKNIFVDKDGTSSVYTGDTGTLFMDSKDVPVSERSTSPVLGEEKEKDDLKRVVVPDSENEGEALPARSAKRPKIVKDKEDEEDEDVVEASSSYYSCYS